jgi:hypothetical protein
VAVCHPLIVAMPTAMWRRIQSRKSFGSSPATTVRKVIFTKPRKIPLIDKTHNSIGSKSVKLTQRATNKK